MFDLPLPVQNGESYAGTYYEQGVNGWTGPTSFYRWDQRAPLTPDEGKTWAPIYFWADLAYTEPEMFIELDPLIYLGPPPPDRYYALELLYVPDGIVGAPPVGTVWEVSYKLPTRVYVPAFPTKQGLTGYQFAFTISPVDPCIGTPLGDSSCDGLVDFGDINYFVAAMQGEAVWTAAHGGWPDCDYVCANDVNEDGLVDFGDINPFVDLLTGAEEE